MVAHTDVEVSESIDQRVFLRGVTWSEYETLLAMRGERAVPRIYYSEGVGELMSPSRQHERIKKVIARLVEAYGDEMGIDMDGIGSWTLKKKGLERGAEPDECYSMGDDDEDRDVPDFVIEVVWTGGGLEKRELYFALGVKEMWIWENDRLTVHSRRSDGYEAVPRSEFLPALDLELLARHVRLQGHSAAVREYRTALRQDEGK